MTRAAAPAEGAVLAEGFTGRGVRVAVIDSGWDRTQPHPRVLPGAAFLLPDGRSDPAAPADDHDRIGHGTACADLILRGAPDAVVLPVRIFGDRLVATPAALAAAIRWAAAAGADVLNLSLGVSTAEGIRELYAACEYARRRGVVVVAANLEGSFSCPAVFENAVGVGALPGCSTWRVSSRPDEAVECLANAVHDGVLWLGGERRRVAGTSFAAPVAAAAVARLREAHPGAAIEEVRARLAACAAAP